MDIMRLVGLCIWKVVIVGHLLSFLEVFGAGSRNRTHVIWLQIRGSTIELHRQDLPAGRPWCRVGRLPGASCLVYTGETLNTRQYRRALRRKTTWRPAWPSRWSLSLWCVSWRCGKFACQGRLIELYDRSDISSRTFSNEVSLSTYWPDIVVVWRRRRCVNC